MRKKLLLTAGLALASGCADQDLSHGYPMPETTHEAPREHDPNTVDCYAVGYERGRTVEQLPVVCEAGVYLQKGHMVYVMNLAKVCVVLGPSEMRQEPENKPNVDCNIAY